MTLRRAQPWLGTFVEVEATCCSYAAATRAIDEAFAAIRRVHLLMSRHDDRSDVQRINRAAAGERVPVHRWTAHVLRRALEISRASHGAFDVVVPSTSARQTDRYTWRDLEVRRSRVNSNRWSVRKRRAVGISLDGIAKGFAVDQAVRALRAHGARSGLVNAGGDLRCFGDRRFRVAIRKPDSDRPAPVLAVDIRDCAMATSGAYFDARLWNSATYARRPPDSCNVTIIAPAAMLADALTKATGTESAAAQSLLRRFHARGWHLRNRPGGVEFVPLHGARRSN